MNETLAKPKIKDKNRVLQSATLFGGLKVIGLFQLMLNALD